MCLVSAIALRPEGCGTRITHPRLARTPPQHHRHRRCSPPPLHTAQGIFVGCLLSMSSTAVVVKCLEVMRSSSSAYGQITVGTLILQVRGGGVQQQRGSFTQASRG